MNNVYELFVSLGEYGAAGMFKEINRSLFYRKSLGIRMYYENLAIVTFSNTCSATALKDR